jgi:hypothetical protein
VMWDVGWTILDSSDKTAEFRAKEFAVKQS